MLLPPGSILQLIHFTNRISKEKPGFFIEVGPGNGALSNVLLGKKWRGIGVELDKDTALSLKNNLKTAYKKSQYNVLNKDFLKFKYYKKVDLIIASMVIEHLGPKEENQFLITAKQLLKKNGLLLCYVPGSPQNWGVEDEIAGHYRRYTKKTIKKYLNQHGWKTKRIEGLTYPLSNIFLPISNWLVKKHESAKLKKSKKLQTQLSGRRRVPFKTEFPKWFKIILNPFTLYPFVWLQNIFKENDKCLTIFFEATP